MAAHLRCTAAPCPPSRPPACSTQESVGGGDRSNHGRRKLLMGHLRSLLQRSQASTAEVRALHGLCREVEARQRQAHEQ